MNATPKTPFPSSGRHAAAKAACTLLVLLSAGWIVLDSNSLPVYIVCFCILCNMATLEWSLLLEEKKKLCHRWLILLLGLPYPWLLGFDGVRTFTVSVLGCTYRSGGQHEYPDPWNAAIAFIGFIAMAALLWEMTRSSEPEKSLASVSTDLLVSIVPVWFFSWGIIAILNESINLQTLVFDACPPAVKIILISLSFNAASWLINRSASGFLPRRNTSSSPSPIRKPWHTLMGPWLLVSAIWIIITVVQTPLFSLDYEHTPPPRIEILRALLPQSLTILATVLAVACMTACGNRVCITLKRSIGLTRHRSLLPGLPGFVPLLCGPSFAIAGWQLLNTAERLFHYIFT